MRMRYSLSALHNFPKREENQFPFGGSGGGSGGGGSGGGGGGVFFWRGRGY